jgi:hypothetical protein
VKVRRLLTWPFAAFLFGYAGRQRDPTMHSTADIILSGFVVGLALALFGSSHWRPCFDAEIGLFPVK